MGFARRLNGLQERMAGLGLGLVVYGPSPDFSYLTGLPLGGHDVGARAQSKGGSKCPPARQPTTVVSPAGAGHAANNLFVPRKGAPVLTVAEALGEGVARGWIADVRICKEGGYPGLVETVLRDLGVKGGRIALGGCVAEPAAKEIARAARGAEVHAAKGLMDRLRIIKDPEEIERLRRVAELTGRALEAVIPKIREGVTQGELEEEVAYQGRRLGASGVSFSPAAKFVRRGSEVSAEPFTYPKEKGLVSGTSIAFDMGFVMDGYSSDFGRSFYFGRADDDVRKGYRALTVALLETASGMRDGGMRMCDLFPAVERTLDRLGYGDYLRARLPTGILGHSIGIEVHEDPWIGPDSLEPLRANMVLALEPKLWRAGQYYLRVEDMVLVGERETEFLTRFDLELFEL